MYNLKEMRRRVAEGYSPDSTERKEGGVAKNAEFYFELQIAPKLIMACGRPGSVNYRREIIYQIKIKSHQSD